MRKLILIGVCLAAAVLSAGEPLYKGKFREFPVPGTIAAAAGTVELTLNPAKPASEFENEWAFAFSMVPAIEGEEAARTLLGICISSGENGQRALLGVARSGKQTARVSGPREQIFVKGRPVNVALSWGEAGLILSVDGRELSRAPFSGKLSPMPGSFSVSAGPPFFASAIRVSARQLQGAELDSTPDTPFPPGESTTLLADLRSGKTELLTAAGQSGATLLPVWSFDDSLSLPGEKAVLRLSGANFSDTEQDFLLRLTGRETDGAALPEVRETIRIPARTRQKEFQIELPVRTPGHYSFTLECGGERYVFSHAELNRPDEELPDGRFADYIGHHLFDLPHVLAKTGIRNSRSDAFHWFIVEPEKGQFDWRWSDAIVERNREAGIRMLGILGSPPVWAADSAIVPTHKNADMSARRKPADPDDWERYVRAVAERYRGKVAAWEIWNEVDWHPPAPAASFSGSTADYLELLKRAHRAIRSADPEAKILVSGFGYGAACDNAMPFELLTLGAASYCDFYNVHSYQGLKGIAELKRAVEQARPGMKLWQTEQMWHTIADPAMQAKLTAAIQFWFIEEGFEKYLSFGEDFFVSHQTLSPIPSLPALAFAQAMLRKCDRYTGQVTQTPLDLRHGFRRTDGSILTVLGRTAAAAVWELEGEVDAVYDLYGREVKFSGASGKYRTLRPTEIIYVVSRQKLTGFKEIAETTNFCPNYSFEEISGDVVTGGLKNAAAMQWQLRDRQFDPQGRIAVTTDAAAGNYALELTSSGAGRVYAFFDARVPGPERCLFSGSFKNTGAKPVSPYFDVFDRNSGYFKRYHTAPVAPGDGFVRRSVKVEIPASDATLVFCVGIERPGTLVMDDIALERVSNTPIPGCTPLSLPAGAPRASLGEKHVGTEELGKALHGKELIHRIPFRFSSAPVLLSAAAWKGIHGSRLTLPVDVRPEKLFLLLTAAYVPEQAETLGRVHFVRRDGSRTSPAELCNKRELRDWFLAADSRGIPPAFRFVTPRMLEYGLFLVEIDNPDPTADIAAVELEATGESLLILAGASLLVK